MCVGGVVGGECVKLCNTLCVPLGGGSGGKVCIVYTCDLSGGKVC